MEKISEREIWLNAWGTNDETIVAVQGEAQARGIRVHLRQPVTIIDPRGAIVYQEQPIDLTGKSVELWVKKTDGTEASSTGEIENATEGIARLPITSQMCALSGKQPHCEVRVIEETKLLKAVLTQFIVLEAIDDSGVVSSDDYSTLLETIGDAKEATTAANTAATSATNAATSATGAAKSANDAAKTAITEAGKATSAAAAANTAATTANTAAGKATTEAGKATTAAGAANTAAAAANEATALLKDNKPVIDLMATGSGTAYTAQSDRVKALEAGMLFVIRFSTANTGAVTLNINSLGAKPVKQITSTGAQGDCIAGDFGKEQRYWLQYDGTVFYPVGASARAAKSGIWIGDTEPPADAGYALWIDPSDPTPGELAGFGTLNAGDIPKFSGDYLVPAVPGSDYSKPLVGEIKMWPLDTPPPGYLLCNGDRLQGADYPELYAVIGKTFGGDEFDTFWLPDLRGRVAVGKSSDTEFSALGKTGGNKSVSHAHGSSKLAAALDVNSFNNMTFSFRACDWSIDGYRGFGELTSGGGATGRGLAIYGSTDSTATSTLQPYLTINYIIKY